GPPMHRSIPGSLRRRGRPRIRKRPPMSQTLDRSATLYNPELAPESATNTWKTLNLFNWWMAGWHSMAGYTMAIGLFAFGLNGWQAIIAFIAGAIILYWANNLTGVAGQREKVPFPVFARAA